jgi:hypothetical protein
MILCLKCAAKAEKVSLALQFITPWHIGYILASSLPRFATLLDLFGEAIATLSCRFCKLSLLFQLNYESFSYIIVSMARTFSSSLLT